MWSSKDIGLVAVLAALGFVTAVSVGQIGYLLVGVPGINYIFLVFQSIQTGFALLVYQGKRWRFLAQMTIFTILIIPVNLGGVAFDFLGKTHYIIAAFFTDLIANSTYNYFKKHNKTKYWAVLNGGLLFWILQPSASITVNLLLFVPQTAQFISVVALLWPLIIVESVAGSYIGYKIYRRIAKGSIQ